MAMFQYCKTQSGTFVDVLDPSEVSFGIQDISDPDAGRDASLRMWKGRLGQKMQVALAWNNPSPSETATLLTMFDEEYFFLKFTNPKTNTTITKEFYAGDRTAPIQQWFVKDPSNPDKFRTYSKVSVTCIER